VGFSKVTRDLTERKKAEDKLIEYTNQLEFQNRELEQFAYAASHDMKEPLRKINFYNSYVVENAGQLLDERSREYLNRSSGAAKRMSQLIEDILAYTKITSAAESFEETDLNEIVEEIAFSHRDTLEEKEVTIEVEGLPTMQVVPFQFRQLMDNLITNAVKYRHPDRKCIIKITSELVKGSELKTKEVVDPRLQYHKISVIDNGLGFNQNYAEKIFEIFQRLNHQSGNKGSGIGLALCKRIVQNHHGFIVASGIEDEGARFDIYLPAS
jgi:light-regulated signal transduction histidine kinase (bacteriophytochrome)